MRKRARPYRLIALWSAIAGLYLLALSTMYSLPPPDHTTAFSKIAVHFSQGYWTDLGIAAPNLLERWWGVIPGWLLVSGLALIRVLVVVVAIFCVVRRQFKPLTVLALIGQLSLEAPLAIENRIGMNAIPAVAITDSALAQVTYDTSVVASTDPETLARKHALLCPMTGARAAFHHVGTPAEGTCDPRLLVARLHYDVMQYAYLTDNPALARSHLNAIDKTQIIENSTWKWRIAIIREWLGVRGFAPAPDSYTPAGPSAAAFRVTGHVTLALAAVSLLIAVLAAPLDVILRRRAIRLDVMMAQSGLRAGA